MWEATGPVTKMWSMAVDREEPWRVVKLVGVALRDQAVPGRERA